MKTPKEQIEYLFGRMWPAVSMRVYTYDERFKLTKEVVISTLDWTLNNFKEVLNAELENKTPKSFNESIGDEKTLIYLKEQIQFYEEAIRLAKTLKKGENYNYEFSDSVS